MIIRVGYEPAPNRGYSTARKIIRGSASVYGREGLVNRPFVDTSYPYRHKRLTGGFCFRFPHRCSCVSSKQPNGPASEVPRLVRCFEQRRRRGNYPRSRILSRQLLAARHILGQPSWCARDTSRTAFTFRRGAVHHGADGRGARYYVPHVSARFTLLLGALRICGTKRTCDAHSEMHRHRLERYLSLATSLPPKQRVRYATLGECASANNTLCPIVYHAIC